MQNKDNKRKTIIVSMVFLFLIILTSYTTYLYINWSSNYRNKIYPGIRIGQINLQGLTLREAEELITKQADSVSDHGLNLSYANKEVRLPSVMSLNTDLSFPVFTFDVDQTIQKISESSPKDSFWSYLTNSVFSVLKDKNITMAYSLDMERAKAYINEDLKDLLVEPLNASFTAEKTNNQEVAFKINPERIGKQIDFELTTSEIQQRLESLDKSTINLKTITARPGVTTQDLQGLEDEAKILISRGDLILTATASSSTEFKVKKETVASWLKSQGEKNNYHLDLDDEKITNYITKNIAPEIDIEVKEPRYEIKNGKMVSWQNGADGQKINIPSSIAKIKESYLINGSNQAELIIDKTKSDITEQTNEINIQELIGTGHSNFSGSPANRRANIKVGAAAVHGMLIAPGEEFSLVKTLGVIDASTGYLPELVIKNNKTIPEYGGGLCQVATTVFRSALSSGLPITARQNHSYRVSYYEPAGTDAAVYDPWPDMRFLNDTGNYILIQSRIAGNDIYFDFWGKKDGRVASSSKPTIYNITKPAPAKLIETDSLKPGEKKCTEKAHNGADAYFDYAVNYPDGNTKNVRFKSHYVPWQEVCLIGKSATSTPIIATSTPKTTATSTAQ
jgi:vancomycin resistance protein YoaR